MIVGFMQQVYQTGSNMSQLDNNKSQEKILIKSAYLNSVGKLVLNVTNQGGVTSQLTRLWIINQTNNQDVLIPFSNLYVKPGASASNVTKVALTSGKNYLIQVTTALGNIASYNLVPAVRARVSIIADSTPIIGNNVTVTLAITNNDTSGNNIYNLVPQLTVSPGPALILKQGPTPSSISLLSPGSTAYFSYVYKVTGSGFAIALNGTFVNAEIVKQGYASLMTIPPNVKYADLFLRLYQEARENRRGLWQ